MSDGGCSLFHFKIRNKESNKQLLLPTYVYTSAEDELWLQDNKSLVLQNIIDTLTENLEYIEKNIATR